MNFSKFRGHNLIFLRKIGIVSPEFAGWLNSYI